jgi:hypothetical protein
MAKNQLFMIFSRLGVKNDISFPSYKKVAYFPKVRHFFGIYLIFNLLSIKQYPKTFAKVAKSIKP